MPGEGGAGSEQLGLNQDAPLADVVETVIAVLSDSNEPISTSEIAWAVAKRGGTADIDQIKQVLRGGLDGRIERVRGGLWQLGSCDRSLPEPKVLAESRPPSEDLAQTPTIADDVSTDSEVAEHVVDILLDSDEPLSISDVVWSVVERRGYADAGQVRQALQSGLDDRAERVEGNLWQWSSELPRPVSVTPETASEPEPVPPLLAVAQITKALERAHHITSALALAGEPTESATIAERLRESGVPISKREVDTALRTTLAGWVKQRTGGRWLLSSQFDKDALQHPATSVASPPPLQKADTEDAVTPLETEDHPPEAEAHGDIRATVIGISTSYAIETTTADDPSLFFCRAAGADLKIVLNRSHPAFDLVTETPGRTAALLLKAWARLESDLPGPRRERAAELRQEWGRALRAVLREHPDSPTE